MKRTKNILIYKSVALALCIMMLHACIPSMINGFQAEGLGLYFKNLYDSEYARDVFFQRYESPVFRLRPFVLELQRLLNKLGVPFQLSFNVLNTAGLFIMFYVLGSYQLAKSSKSVKSFYLPEFFFLSMPILFAFVPSVYTYDDIFQYVFLFIFLHCFFAQKYYLAVVFITLACMIRETSFFYLFLVFAFSIKGLYGKMSIKFYTIWLFPFVAYFFFHLWYVPESILLDTRQFFINRRFTAWEANFFKMHAIRESLPLLLVMTAPYVMILYSKIRVEPDEKNVFAIRLAIFFLIIHNAIVCVTGLVREFRLFLLPLLWIVPLIYDDITNRVQSVWRRRLHFSKIGLITFLMSFVFAFIFYQPLAKGIGYLFKTYV